MEKENKKYNVPALEKAIAIIETLSEQSEPVGVSKLCKMLDIPKTSVFFILNTLEQHGYISKMDDGGYVLGTKLMSIGLSILKGINIRDFAKEYMEQLQRETGFTVHLAILDQGEAMYVEKVENNAFVKFNTYVGQKQSLHASGVGKALAAYIPEKRLIELLGPSGLLKKTENTITSLEDFLNNLKIIREQGYSIEDEEGEIGIRCIGSPIFDHEKKLKAAISITALRSELQVHEIPIIGEKVRQTALDISQGLGYREEGEGEYPT